MLEPVKWTVTSKTTSATTADIIFTAKMDRAWHIYAMELPAAPADEVTPSPTAFVFGSLKNARKVGKTQTTAKLHKEYDPNFEMELAWYEGVAVFVQKIEFADAAKVSASGQITYMTCNDQSCLADKYDFSIPKLTGAENFPAAANAADTFVAEPETDDVADITPAVAPLDTAQLALAAAIPVSVNSAQKEAYWRPVISELQQLGETAYSNLWLVFLLGLLGGFVALFTPCVWPIIPMTVSYFMKRGGDKRRGRRDALLYGLSIVIIYVALGMLITGIFGASALNKLSSDAIFNLFFFALLIIFAISFFGAFDITLPASWTNKIDAKAENTSGFFGILLMAFTLALVSFSCTGPIIGTLLVEVSTNGNYLAPAIGMLGFAIALAIPFTLFAFFPSLLKSMPKSGGWLNSVKVVLAFLELALSLKFLSVADMALRKKIGWEILDRETFIALWIVIFALLGIYLLGKLRFKHDSESKHTSVLGLFLGTISLAFAVYLVPGLWGAPLKAISAFAPPTTTQDFNLNKDNEVHAKFTDYEQGMAYAAQVGKPAVIDFTGFACVNCRNMEVAVWIDPRVKDILENDVVLISLWVDDKTPLAQPYEVTENGKIQKINTIGDKWSYLERVKFGANAQPFYLILDGNGNPLNKSYVYDKDKEAFIKWLKTGINKYEK
jgi:thiol:disulfide interchange protein DsbD